jgi:hypothetical protein
MLNNNHSLTQLHWSRGYQYCLCFYDFSGVIDLQQVIQLVTIRAALKQIENFNVIKMKKNKKYHAAETILKSSLGVYGV